MSSPVYYLFVYGSLRSGFRSPMYEYMSKYFHFIGEAQVKGRLYHMGEYPAGVPANENQLIKGELYEAKGESEFQYAIGQLDDYEGISPELGERPLFRRELVQAFVDDKIVTAWIYWYNGDTSGRPLIESGDLIEYLKNKETS
jgi:gamma-glutamylcyclotransferase (GGCT)/AIG2-like uncharacterized protein YtfP